MLAEDDMDIGERSSKNFVGKQIPPADYSAEVARVLQLNDNNPEELMNVAPIIAEDLIKEVNNKKKEIIMELPKGLLDV